METGKVTNMMIKLLGVAFVVFGCGHVGFRIAAGYKQEERALRELITILNYLGSELEYRMTPLPDLLNSVAKTFSGVPAKILGQLGQELEAQVSPDVASCMDNILNRTPDIPSVTHGVLFRLGTCLGRFDLAGQLKELESVGDECHRNLKALEYNRDSRLRSYQTLGLCAGAALAILLV